MDANQERAMRNSFDRVVDRVDELEKKVDDLTKALTDINKSIDVLVGLRAYEMLKETYKTDINLIQYLDKYGYRAQANQIGYISDIYNKKVKQEERTNVS